MAVRYDDDPEYANAKLSDSVVSMGDLLIYVLRVEGRDTVVYSPIGHTNERKLTLLRDLNLTPISLGYLNHRQQCAYLSRIPARHYRQGLRGNVLAGLGGLRGFNLLSCSEMANTASGIFPTLPDAYEEIICGEATSRAFSRDFALIVGSRKSGMSLHFKGREVGTCSWGDRGPNINLSDSFRYLNEFLMETLDGQKNL